MNTEFAEEISNYSIDELELIVSDQHDSFTDEEMYLIEAQLKLKYAERKLDLARNERSYALPCVIGFFIPVIGICFLIYYMITKNTVGCKKMLAVLIVDVLIYSIVIQGRSFF